MKRNILRIIIAVVVSLIMGVIGLNIGSLFASDFAPHSFMIVFTVVTMGAFIMNEIQKSKNAN